MSEPSGFFQSDNLLSNETGYQMVIPELLSRVGEGGAYLGVGPEQNFTYIAALKPRIAFIVDVRRGNLHLHLMYKALFELAADRADFVSLLFSRARPADVARDATPAELFAAFEAIAPVDADYQRNLARITEHLVTTRHLPLSSEDLKGIDYVYSNFFRFGPGIGYSSSRSGRGGTGTMYAALMRTTDPAGATRSYLASEANFGVVKRLESANLIVPVVGNFSGPKALRAVATWLRDRNAKVSAYYLSNVEDYLSRDNTWLDFCRSAATLPLAEKGTFIRSGGGYRAVGRSGLPPAPPTVPQPTIPSDQIAALASKGGGTITLADGRVVTVTTTAAGTSASFAAFVGGGGVTTNRLGLIGDDLAPCAVPKGASSALFIPGLARWRFAQDFKRCSRRTSRALYAGPRATAPDLKGPSLTQISHFGHRMLKRRAARARCRSATVVEWVLHSNAIARRSRRAWTARASCARGPTASPGRSTAKWS